MFDRLANIDSREGFSPDEEIHQEQAICDICGKPCGEIRPGNPKVYHVSCAFDSLKERREGK